MTIGEKLTLAQMATLWQDREIRFDTDKKHLGLVMGEDVLIRIYKAEDVKGGEGKVGSGQEIREIAAPSSQNQAGLDVGTAQPSPAPPPKQAPFTPRRLAPFL